MTSKTKEPEHRSSKSLRTLHVDLPAPPAERWDEMPELDVYVYDQRRRFLGIAAIDRGKASLQSDFGSARLLRGVIAPRGMPVDAVARSKALPSLAISSKQAELPTLQFPHGWWEDLVFGQLVSFHGRVEKVIGDHTLPIREGVVEVFEVDPWIWIVKQPELELERFRDDLLRLIEPLYEKEPIPWPVPGPDPGPEFAKFADIAMGDTPLVLATPEERLSKVRADLVAAPKAARSIQTQMLKSLEGDALRSYLELNKPLLTPLLVLLMPEWWYRRDKLCEVAIQPDGSFWGFAGWWQPGLDRPDLYFRVRQVIDGSDKLIYAPSMSGHTWWNYANEDVVLRVTDPQAVAVEDALVAEDDQVVFLGVGFDTTTDLAGAEGLVQTGTDAGLYRHPSGKLAPYGNLLHVVLDVDLNGLQAAGVSYYRLSWQRGKQSAIGSASHWTPLTTPIARHYREVKMVGGNTVVTYPVVSMVPAPADVPTLLTGAEGIFRFADPVRDYVVIDRADRAFGVWDTEALAGEGVSDGDVADTYTLRLEVFDAAGHDITASTPLLHIHAKESDDSYSTTTLSANQPFLFVHVDNRPVVAEVRDQIEAGTTSTGTGCGFLVAGSSADVEVGIKAYHPGGVGFGGDPDRFLESWHYKLTRGSTATPRVDVTVTDKNVGSAVGWQAVPYTPDIPLQTVDHLLQGVTLAGSQRRCTFNVRLEAHTLTRNGYGRLHTLDRADNAAFALIERN